MAYNPKSGLMGSPMSDGPGSVAQGVDISKLPKEDGSEDTNKLQNKSDDLEGLASMMDDAYDSLGFSKSEDV